MKTHIKRNRPVSRDEAARIVRDARRTAVAHGPPTVVLAWAVWLVLPRPPAVFLVGSGLVTLSWLVTVAVWLQGRRLLKRQERESRPEVTSGRVTGGCVDRAPSATPVSDGDCAREPTCCAELERSLENRVASPLTRLAAARGFGGLSP